MKIFQILLIFVFSIIFGTVTSQTFDINSLKTQLKQFSFFEGLDDLDISTQCRKNGAPVVSIQKEQEKLSKCITEYFTASMRQEHITRGQAESMRARIGLVCKYEPGAHKCIEQYSNNVKPCMNKEDQEAYVTIVNIIYKALEYMCYKNGDRVSTFIEEGGPQCIQERQELLTKCLENMGNTSETLNANVIVPSLSLINEKDCRIIDGLRTCIYNQLIKCKNNNPANILNDFINFLEERLTCLPPTKTKSTSNALVSASTTLKWNLDLLGVTALLLLFRWN